MSQAYPHRSRRGLSGLVAVLALVAALCLLLIPGAADSATRKSEAAANVAKKKKQKQKPVRVMTQNLYLGTDLTPIIAAANAGQASDTTCGTPIACAAARAAAGDNFLNEVGFALKDVQTNDFAIRAQTIAKEIKQNKPDIVGLQEAALWKLAVPPIAPATTPLIDYSDTLLEALNKKAMSKKQCNKKGLKGDKCYRGYKQVTLQQEADVEQPGDFDNNPGPDGIGGTGPGFPPPCTGGAAGAAALAAGVAGFDDTGVSTGDPGPGPAAANLDYNGDFNGVTPPPTCNGTTVFQTDPPGTSDCAGNDLGDTNPNPVPPGTEPNTPTCFLNGIDGLVRLQMRDAIIVRKGAHVKTRNPQGGHYGHVLTLPVGSLGTAEFTRGWTSVQATVRGMSFHFVDTHLESENIGTIREDQASELVDFPGGPATANNTVLVGDLNSDPSIQPGSNPNTDNASNVAYNRIAAAGFVPLTGPANTDGHKEILNDPNDNTFTKRIDWILTNSPSITMRSSKVLNTFANGLWGSDHGGVLSVLNVPGKGHKKK